MRAITMRREAASSGEAGAEITPPLVVPSADARMLDHLFRSWEPERPELLVRLRPRLREARHGAR
jgi:hypothetical protein